MIREAKMSRNLLALYLVSIIVSLEESIDSTRRPLHTAGTTEFFYCFQVGHSPGLIVELRSFRVFDVSGLDID
jgi:hypothetical protein